MEKFDRELQREMLSILISTYPETPRSSDYGSEVIDNAEPQKLTANIFYLAEHRLINIPQTNAALDPEGNRWLFEEATVTAKGIDFMLNDGGLSAILDVQTIRLHSDTIEALEDIISLANLPEPERVDVVAKLRQLPSDAIGHLTNELLSKAVSAGPAALQIMYKYLSGG